MCGHGGGTCVSLLKDWCISCYELAESFLGLKYETLTIAIDSCYAGGFIPVLSEDNRIIITCTDDSTVAHGGVQSPFSYVFFRALENKCSYGEAFNYVGQFINWLQNPLIDDNGDCVGSINSEDESGLALKTYPGYTNDDSLSKPYKTINVDTGSKQVIKRSISNLFSHLSHLLQRFRKL
jgi:hypothetical protein